MTHFLQISPKLWQNYLKTFQRGQKQLAIPPEDVWKRAPGDSPLPCIPDGALLDWGFIQCTEGGCPQACVSRHPPLERQKHEQLRVAPLPTLGTLVDGLRPRP